MSEVYVARWYHVILFPDWLRRLLQKPEKFLADFVGPGMTVADIGCGMGFCSMVLADMVGEKGLVLAVDMQAEMLNWAKRKTQKAGFSERIAFIQCSQDDIKISEPIDFALTMWMVHEVPDRERFFKQLSEVIKPGGKYLLAEPAFHVKPQLYNSICSDAETAGFRKISEPKVGLSMSTLFQK